MDGKPQVKSLGLRDAEEYAMKCGNQTKLTKDSRRSTLSQIPAFFSVEHNIGLHTSPSPHTAGVVEMATSICGQTARMIPTHPVIPQFVVSTSPLDIQDLCHTIVVRYFARCIYVIKCRPTSLQGPQREEGMASDGKPVSEGVLELRRLSFGVSCKIWLNE